MKTYNQLDHLINGRRRNTAMIFIIFYRKIAFTLKRTLKMTSPLACIIFESIKCFISTTPKATCEYFRKEKGTTNAQVYIQVEGLHLLFTPVLFNSLAKNTTQVAIKQMISMVFVGWPPAPYLFFLSSLCPLWEVLELTFLQLQQ